MNSVGLVLPHLGVSQISYYALNEFEKHKELNRVIFFENLLSSMVIPSCATMCVNQLPNFSGTLVTSTIENTLLALNLCNPKITKIIFYIWDLEWLRRGKNNYLYNLPAYQKSHSIISRSKYHVGPIKNYCGREPTLIESFNLEEILR